MATQPQATQRRTRSDGERSRAAILAAAGKLATVDGLEGITIGRLADHIGMSKSGLYAHFGSKEDLQLATVAYAEEVFNYEVLLPAQQEEPGLPRLKAYVEHWISHVQRAVFPGGCFFVAGITEFAPRTGAVRDRIAMYVAGWGARLREEVAAAQEQGDLDPTADPDQIVFEIQSALVLSNILWVLTQQPGVFDRTRTAISSRIAASRRD